MRPYPEFRPTSVAYSIWNRVRETMMEAEGLGGPEGGEYERLMKAIAAEADDRRATFVKRQRDAAEQFIREAFGMDIAQAIDAGLFDLCSTIDELTDRIEELREIAPKFDHDRSRLIGTSAHLREIGLP